MHGCFSVLLQANFDHHATIIQKCWRGHHSRAHVHDFYKRKQFLQSVAAANAAVKAEMEAELQAALEHKQREAQAAAKHNFDTQVCPAGHTSGTPAAWLVLVKLTLQAVVGTKVAAGPHNLTACLGKQYHTEHQTLQSGKARASLPWLPCWCLSRISAGAQAALPVINSQHSWHLQPTPSSSSRAATGGIHSCRTAAGAPPKDSCQAQGKHRHCTTAVSSAQAAQSMRRCHTYSDGHCSSARIATQCGAPAGEAPAHSFLQQWSEVCAAQRAAGTGA